jgi:hypothetical protein
MIPTYFITIIYFITLLVGLFNIKKFTGSTSILFLVIISLGFFVELQGTLSQYVFQHNSRIGYNIYKFLSLVLYFIFFYKCLTDSFKKKLVYSIGIFFIAFSFIHYLFIHQSFLQFNLTVSLVGAFSLIAVIFIYLADVLNSDKILQLQFLLTFWVALGNIFFFIGYLPVFTLAKKFGFYYMYDVIVLTLNIIMNVFFIIGFIKSKKELHANY